MESPAVRVKGFVFSPQLGRAGSQARASGQPGDGDTAPVSQATRRSLEIYSRLAVAAAQQRYDDVIGIFPV